MTMPKSQQNNATATLLQVLIWSNLLDALRQINRYPIWLRATKELEFYLHPELH